MDTTAHIPQSPAEMAALAHRAFDDRYWEVIKERRRAERRQHPILGLGLRALDRRFGVDRRA